MKPGDYVADSRGPIVTTYPSGTKLHPFSPAEDEIHLVDIAHHLSLVCRFGGGCGEFYSVAQHSVLVMELLEHTEALVAIGYVDREELGCVGQEGPDGGLARRLVRPVGLMHDSEEYIFGDMTAPVKSRYPEYADDARRLRDCIFSKLKILAGSDAFWPAVKIADRLARRVEAAKLGKAPLDEEAYVPEIALALLDRPWTPAEARAAFLQEASRWWRASLGEAPLEGRFRRAGERR